MEKSTRKTEDKKRFPILQCDAGSVFISILQFDAVSPAFMQPISRLAVVARNRNQTQEMWKW